MPAYFQKGEMDEETGLYYYGARYLDPKYSRWLSGDPALGDYIPKAPIDDEAKKHNENLPGMGGVYNIVNMHLYHYAGNNPVKYTDPDGRAIHKLTDEQWAIVENAKNRTVGNLDKIIEALNNCDNDISKLDPKILESAQTYLHSEFGSLPLDLPLLADTLNELKEHIGSLTRDDFRYDDATSSYAYTSIFTDDVWLGDRFFAAPDTGDFDTKEGTLLHEVTHYFLGLGTFDSTYNHEQMKKLPDEGFFKSKSRNANNWEYFYEKLVE